MTGCIDKETLAKMGKIFFDDYGDKCDEVRAQKLTGFIETQADKICGFLGVLTAYEDDGDYHLVFVISCDGIEKTKYLISYNEYRRPCVCVEVMDDDCNITGDIIFNITTSDTQGCKLDSSFKSHSVESCGDCKKDYKEESYLSCSSSSSSSYEEPPRKRKKHKKTKRKKEQSYKDCCKKEKCCDDDKCCQGPDKCCEDPCDPCPAFTNPPPPCNIPVMIRSYVDQIGRMTCESMIFCEDNIVKLRVDSGSELVKFLSGTYRIKGKEIRDKTPVCKCKIEYCLAQILPCLWFNPDYVDYVVNAMKTVLITNGCSKSYIKPATDICSAELIASNLDPKHYPFVTCLKELPGCQFGGDQKKANLIDFLENDECCCILTKWSRD